MNGVLPEDTFEFVMPADVPREAIAPQPAKDGRPAIEGHPGRPGRPESQRRVLIYRHGRASKWLQWARRAREIGAMQDWAERLEAYADLLRTGLVGVRNLDAGNLLDGLDQSELAIAAEGVPGAAMLSEFDRKKSPSPSQSDTAPCAASAEAGAGA